MKSFPLNKTFTLLESGPVILVVTQVEERANIMTISWTMVMDFSPRFAFVTGEWNYSYKALSRTRECVIAIPDFDMSEKVARIGSCSGETIDKFEKFNLTPVKASFTRAPLIKECSANIECAVIDHIEKHDIFVLEAKRAWIDETRKEKRFFHAIGDGTFVADGERRSHRKIMRSKLPF